MFRGAIYVQLRLITDYGITCRQTANWQWRQVAKKVPCFQANATTMTNTKRDGEKTQRTQPHRSQLLFV